MARLSWNNIGEREFETGVDRGVLYVEDDAVPWNGLTKFVERPTGGEVRPYYIDGVRYFTNLTVEEFAGSISAFYSPEEFDQCDGSLLVSNGVHVNQQLRTPFGFSFRSRIGNDTIGDDLGYKIHLIYGALARPVIRKHDSVDDDPNLTPLEWSFTTVPIRLVDLEPASHIQIDTRKVHPRRLTWLEDILYGTATNSPRLPEIKELRALYTADPDLFVTNLGGGRYRILGDDATVRTFGGNIFEINSSSVVLDKDPSEPFTLIYL